MPYVKNKEGFSLFYEHFPKKNRPTLIFIHGLATDHTIWSNYIHRLQEDYGILALDLLGHGLSEKPKNRGMYQVGQFAKDLGHMIERLKIRQHYIIGYSLGGLVALEYQISHRTNSLGIILISTALGYHDLTDSFILELRVATRFPQAVYRLLDDGKDFSAAKGSLALYIKCLAKTPPRIADYMLENLKCYSWSGLLPENLLVIIACKDEIVKNRIARLCKDCKAVGGRHMAVIRKSDHIIGMIQEFIGKRQTRRA